MTPTPKDIEAAEKLVDREFLQLCETALAKGQIEDYSALNELFEINRKVAQALAAAREEGRRDMRDEITGALEESARLNLIAKDDAITPQDKNTHEVIAMGRYAAATFIRNLPTNAPEGESDEC